MKQLSCHQRQKYIQIITKGIKRQIEVIIDVLERKGVLNADNFSRIIAKGDRIVPTDTETIKGHLTKIAESVINRVKLVHGAEALDLDEVNCDKVSLEKVKYFYEEGGHTGRNFKIQKILPTKKAKVSVYDLVIGGIYADIFGGMSGNFKRLCLTQAQVVQFAEKHYDYLLDNGHGTFFPVKYGKYGNKFFVINIEFGWLGSLLIRHDTLSDDNFAMWSAKECRFVVLKHGLAN